MKELDQIEWKEFEVQDLFEVTRGNAKDVTKRKFGGDIALISASDKNNAFYDFVEPKDNETIYKNTLTIHNNGNGVGLTFYHNYQFIATSDVTILIDKTNKIDKYVADFLIAILQKQKEKYCYGYKLSKERLKKQKIMLPVNDEQNIDFEFMQEFMKKLEKEKIKQYYDYIRKDLETLDTLHTHTHGYSLENLNWKEFYIKDIFTVIERGKRLKSGDHISGNIPYISSTGINNGVDDFIGNENGKEFEKCLTIANSGSVGSTFYHEYKFIGSDHITALKNEEYNKYKYLFMIPTLSRLNEKYSFNREINDARIKNEKILLPVNDNGKIEFEFIEYYTKNLIKNMLQKYIEYLKVYI